MFCSPSIVQIRPHSVRRSFLLWFFLFFLQVTSSAGHTARCSDVPASFRLRGSDDPLSLNPARCRGSPRPLIATGVKPRLFPGFLRKYSGVLPKDFFDQPPRKSRNLSFLEVKQLMLTHFLLCSVTDDLTCQLVRYLFRVCFSVFLSSFKIYCFAYTTNPILYIGLFVSVRSNNCNIRYGSSGIAS